MSHWAEIDENNVVVRVVVGNNNFPNEGYDWIVENLGGSWLQTSFNTRNGVYYTPNTNNPDQDQSKALRGNYASAGFFYDSNLDAFIPPKPEEGNWVLDESIYSWVEAN
jgi:hypothetical protein